MNQELIEARDASIEIRRYRLRTQEEQQLYDERMAKAAAVAGETWTPSGKLGAELVYLERIFSEEDVWWLTTMYAEAEGKELSVEAKARADTRFGLSYGQWFADLMRAEREEKRAGGPGQRLIWEEGKGLRWGWERNPFVYQRGL